jgi:dienelactone hydrolase
MKSNLIRAAILCITIFVLFGAFAIWYGAGRIKHDAGNRQNVQDLSFILMDYAASHHHYPPALDELLTQSNTNDEREANKILHGGSLQITEYEPRTNGFIFTAHSPHAWFHRGDRYAAEYIQSRTNSVLKINGAIFFENDIKE